MSKTLEELRQALARDLGRFFTGTATGGAVGTIIDTGGLTHFSEDDSLIGALCYIEDTTDEGAPEGEEAWAVDYDAGTSTISVDPDYSAAPGAGDIYELYLAPLTIAQWNQAINLAIREAWPEVWHMRAHHIALGSLGRYDLPTYVEDVVSVYARPFLKDGPDVWGYASERLVEGVHYVIVSREPSESFLTMEMLTPGDGLVTGLLVYYKYRHPELAADTEESDLDYPYLMAAAKANLYHMLAAASGSTASVGELLQLMNHWQKVAAERKQVLGAELLGMSPLARKGG